MPTTDNEEEELRTVALQNAQSILVARRRAEEALRKQSEWLRVTLASIGDGVISTDAQGLVTFMNVVAESLTGWPSDEALGRPLPEVFHIVNEQTLEPVDNPAFRALREGAVVGLANHTVLIARDGSQLPIDDSAAPIRDEAGGVAGAVLVFRDVTERRLEEERERRLLEEAAIANAKFRAFFEQGALFAGIMDVDGTIIEPNRLSWEGCGFTREQVIGKPFWAGPWWARSADLVERIRAGSAQAAAGEMFRAEMPYFVADGSQRIADVIIQPIKDEAGRIVFLAPTGTDITVRKEAEQALRASEEFSRTVIESSPDRIAVLDLDGRLLMKNTSGMSLMEMDDIALFLGRQWVDLWPEESRSLVRKAMADAYAGATGHFRGLGPTVKGTPKMWDVIVTPVRDGDGRIARLVASSRDVTGLMAIEADRERLLAEERHAREIAEAASRAKDEFLATVSHELRTPLNAILGWARLLSGGKLDDQMEARGLKAIEQNARAQAQLIEDLLDVSRIISGKFRLNNQPTQISRTIEAAIDSVRPTAEAKGVRLQVVLDPDAGPVSGDAGRLQQVVWNLLSNAVKFTPRGGQVQVRLMRINSHIELIVTDTGQGIGAELLPRVFDRFWQADGSSTRTHGGLGLGLALVRHIIELHGGSVAAYSPGQDKGATFTVRLPLMVIHAKPDDNERVHPRVSGDGALRFDSSLSLEAVKVLVVDDEPETLLLLSTVLTRCGAYVKTASSAEEGFREVQRWLPDVIVSDIGMPGEDGYSFIARVKTWMRETGTWIPAMALTAYARAEDRMRALAAGYQIHVAKPVEPAELVAVLVSLVERPTTPWGTGR
jgi:PAS domain S-box-containing protein